MLFDNHNRPINYVRLAVTDRCNLRCFYCMPEEGINYLPRKELLSYEEMLRLVSIMAGLGITKVRITGGEPFLRKDMLTFLEALTAIPGIQKVNITTNGTLTEQVIPDLKRIGINSINLSLDSWDEGRFFDITRRNVFPAVMNTFKALLHHDIPTKINAVVMKGRNIDDIIPMVELTKEHPISVRFIEEMPFNGSGTDKPTLEWNHLKILQHIQSAYPSIQKINDPKHATAKSYQIDGFKGTIGIIAAYSRLFCGTCNRIRITPQGMLKTCLYDDGVFNLKNFIRKGASDEQVVVALTEALKNRAKDGFEAEKNRSLNFPVSESMATIGG